MKTNQALELIGDKEFIEKIFGYAYRRCYTSHEAEDLASDIILAVIKAVNRQTDIDNFYPFVWTVAHRIYADHCDKRNRTPITQSYENTDFSISSGDNEIDDFIEEEAAKELLSKTMREISFLAKIYRDVMVMFYLDELSVKQIAAKLDISENAVKQRLFSARNTVKKEVNNKMERNLSLQPVDFYYVGTGNPVGNAPCEVAERLLSKNLVYLCRKKAMTAKEISDALNVPMVFIEEELNIQCHGSNGEYGLIRKHEDEKYIANIPIADYVEYDEANNICEKYLDEVCDIIKKWVEKHISDILGLPFLSKQDDPAFILWPLIKSTYYQIENQVVNKIGKRFFANTEPVNRPYSEAATAVSDGEETDYVFYGYDGTCSMDIAGYRSVEFGNIYGSLIDKHFGCGENISTNKLMLLTVKSIDGLELDSLNESEKEIAAKAIECGYLRKNGNTVEPAIIAFENKYRAQYFAISRLLTADTDALTDRIADELGAFVKKHLPEHLENEYQNYIEMIASCRFEGKLIDRCVESGILCKPEKRLGSEGMILIVEK